MKERPILTALFLVLVLTACAQPKPTETVKTEESATLIRTGAERMDVYLPALKDKRVALCGNQTSVVGKTPLVL